MTLFQLINQAVNSFGFVDFEEHDVSAQTTLRLAKNLEPFIKKMVDCGFEPKGYSEYNIFRGGRKLNNITSLIQGIGMATNQFNKYEGYFEVESEIAKFYRDPSNY